MSLPDFSFDLDASGIDRQSLLSEAALRLDALNSTLGKRSQTSPSTEGNLLRELMQDSIDFASFPDIRRITEQDFHAQNMPVPAQFTRISEFYQFYWIYIPIALFPQHGWGFNRLEMIVEFNPGRPSSTLVPGRTRFCPPGNSSPS